MNSIYQLKTGEFVDLARIVKIGITEEDNKRYSFNITFQLVKDIDKIAIQPSLAATEIKEAHGKIARYINPDHPDPYRIIDKRTIDAACDAGLAAYKKFAEEVRNDLITAWKQFKNKET